MTILVQQQLRELAQAAPHKDWRAGSYYGKPFLADIEVLADTPDGLMVVMQGNQNFTAESVAAVAFVGAASPATVLALLDELDTANANHENAVAHMQSVCAERDQLKAENAELKAQVGKALGPLTLGLRGKAFDPPGTHRAYTYVEQPNNQGAWRLGEALVEAHAMPAGDHIDGGLGLLKALQQRGFGVFEMEKAMTKEQP